MQSMHASIRKDVIKAIDLALSKHLSGSQHQSKKKRQRQSCVAVHDAMDELFCPKDDVPWQKREKMFDRYYAAMEAFDDLIEEMGLSEDDGVDIYEAYSDFTPRRAQRARSVWLTWVKLMLEEKVI